MSKDVQMRPGGHEIEKSFRGSFQEYSEAFVVALILAILVRAFLFQAFEIPSGSMEPTLRVGDHILVNKFIYGVRIPFTDQRWPRFREPRRWDVIVFVYPVDRSKDFIKRVVGVGEDTVEIIDKRLIINGMEVADPYAHFYSGVTDPSYESPRDNMGPIKVPHDSLFVMGDNRDNSLDSRFWGFVPLRDVVGEALMIYWSSRNIIDVRWNRLLKVIH